MLAVLGNGVEQNGGTVDRFTGDGFLAHFGAFGSLLNHADAACKAVMHLRSGLVKINSERYLNEEIVVNIGMGLHNGVVAVGEITTGNTTQKTVIGDTVNTASRIESLTKYFTVDALISLSTRQRLSSELKLRKMPLKKLKGKEQSVQTYWLLPIN